MSDPDPRRLTDPASSPPPQLLALVRDLEPPRALPPELRATARAELPTTRGRSALRWKALAMVAVVLLGIGAVAWQVLSTDHADERVAQVALEGEQSAQAPPLASNPQPPPTPASSSPAPGATAEAAESGAAGDPRAPSIPAPAGRRAAGSDESAAAGAASRRRSPRRFNDHNGSRELRTPGRRPRSDANHGFLSLVTRPWCHVYLNGRLIGQTPIRRARLPEGSHTLVLRNPERDLERRIEVRIVAGEHARLVITVE